MNSCCYSQQDMRRNLPEPFKQQESKVVIVTKEAVDQPRGGGYLRRFQHQAILARVFEGRATALDIGLRRSLDLAKPFPARQATTPAASAAYQRVGPIRFAEDVIAVALHVWPTFVTHNRSTKESRRLLEWIDGERPTHVVLEHPYVTELVPLLRREKPYTIIIDCHDVESYLRPQLFALGLPKGPRLEAVLSRYRLLRLVWFAGGSWDAARRLPRHLYDRQAVCDVPRDTFPARWANGCALFASTKVFKAVGPLDPDYFALWDETDWCYRAERLGFHCAEQPTAQVAHKVSSTVGSDTTYQYGYLLARNRLVLLRKYEGRTRALICTAGQFIVAAKSLTRGVVARDWRAYLWGQGRAQAGTDFLRHRTGRQALWCDSHRKYARALASFIQNGHARRHVP